MIDGYYSYMSDEGDRKENGKQLSTTATECQPSTQSSTAFGNEELFSKWVFSNMKPELMRSNLIVGSLANEEPSGNNSTLKSWLKFNKALGSFEKIKLITRQNVPPHLRARLWQEVTGGSNLMSKTPNLYQEMCEKIFGKDNVFPSEFPPCVLTSDSNFVPYYLNPEGVTLVRKVICVLASMHPDVTVCPMLEPLVALFLHFMDDVWCFACLSSMLMSSKRRMLDQTNIEIAVAAATFEDCAYSTMKHAVKHLKMLISNDYDKQKGTLFPNWQRMIFDNLDFTILVRVVDCFVVEGRKVLYRVGLSLIEFFYRYSKKFQKLSCPTAHHLENAISLHAGCLQITGNELIKVSLKLPLVTKQIQDSYKRNFDLIKSGVIEISKDEDKQTTGVYSIDSSRLSDIILLSQWRVVYSWLPSRIQLRQAVLAFSTETDGYNLKTLYARIEDDDESLLIIRTDQNEIFGAYLSGCLGDRHQRKFGLGYFGNGETFLFCIQPHSRCFPWVGSPKLAMSDFKAKPAVTAEGSYIFVDFQPANEKTQKSRRSSLRKLSTNAFRKNPISVKYKVDPSSILHQSMSARTFGECSADLPRPVPRNFSSNDLESAEKSPRDIDEGLQMKELVQTERSVKLHSRENSRSHDEEVEIENEQLDSDLFIAANDSCLMVGGGGGTNGLWIDGELERGRSAKCSTFNNQPLSGKQDGDFRCTRLEVFRFLDL